MWKILAHKKKKREIQESDLLRNGKKGAEKGEKFLAMDLIGILSQIFRGFNGSAVFNDFSLT